MLDGHLSFGQAGPQYPNLKGKRVLIVEDEIILAVDYHYELKDAGAKAEGFKGTIREALAYLAAHEVDAAIVDFVLPDGTGEPIIEGLRSRGIPFIVVSGSTFRVRSGVDAAQVLSKPVPRGAICRALSQVLN